MRCPMGARPSRLPVQCLQQPVHLLVKAKQASCNSPVFSTFSVLPWPSSILSAVTILSWPLVISTSFAHGSFTVGTSMPRPAARPSSPQPLGRGHSPCSTTMSARSREVDVKVRVLMRALCSKSAHLEPNTSSDVSHVSHHCTLDLLDWTEGTRVSPSRLPVVLHPCPSSPPTLLAVIASGLGTPRDSRKQRSHFTPWYTDAHSGDDDACFTPRRASYLPHHLNIKLIFSQENHFQIQFSLENVNINIYGYFCFQDYFFLLKT